MTKKIGIGVTTQNRRDIFLQMFENLYKNLGNVIYDFEVVVVDDGSDTEYAADAVKQTPAHFIKNKERVGIARAKNQCIHYLYDKECTDFFLFDDDIWPIDSLWYIPYVSSPEHHLMYQFLHVTGNNRPVDMKELYRDDDLVAYTAARGCLTYFDRTVVDTIGGMYNGYGRWGYEHPDFSNRVHNAGLSSFRFADVPNSSDYFYSVDEHEDETQWKVRFEHTVDGVERAYWHKRNKEIYLSRLQSTEYCGFGANTNLVLTQFLTSTIDPQRAINWSPTDAVKMRILELQNSIGDTADFVCITDDPDLHASTDINTYLVSRSTSVSPYQRRHLLSAQYLRAHPEYSKVWCVDATDVTMLREPWSDMQEGVLYVGSEPQITDIPWMREQHPAQWFQTWLKEHAQDTLLNVGLYGGDRADVLKLAQGMASLYFDNETDRWFNHDLLSLGETEMGAFNYIVRERFKNVVYGSLVNTEFKAYKDNGVAWWQHK